MKKLQFISALTILTLSFACNNNTKKIAGFEGEDLMSYASITRDKNTKATTFVSSLTDKWELYYGASAGAIDFSKPILTGNGKGSFSLNVPLDKRGYFQLVTPQGKAMLAERHLPMTGGFNFRDLGGYKTKDNRYVKWGQIIRSDDLSNLTDADLNYLSSLPLKSIVDFRAVSEIEIAKDKVPQPAPKCYTYAISFGNLSAMTNAVPGMDGTQMDKVMQEINVLLVTDTSAIRQYRQLFALLQNPKQDAPLLYHCTAGKDRTGMATALILYALGVDEQTVMQDYLMSNQYIKEKFAAAIKAQPQLAVLFSVKEQYLQAGINQIKKDHGSVEAFLTKHLDVDMDKMKKLY